MKLVKLQIPRDYLLKIGLEKLFFGIERLEIIKAFNYSKNSFFTLQQITFEEGVADTLSQDEVISLLSEQMFANNIEIIEADRNRIVCILHQIIPPGFWNVPDEIPWAIQFPLVVGPKYLLLTCIVANEYLSQLKEQFEAFYQADDPAGFRVLAQSPFFEKGDTYQPAVNSPPFTVTQQKIASYAASYGYFESPKKISAKDIAETFKISESAVNNHLRNAGNLAMRFFFGSH